MNKNDLNLYSRQISTYGMDIMLKIKNMKVIVFGMRGLGIEISKNIILSGISELCIFDDTICSISDLSSNFYISEEDVNKKRRDEACLDKIRELNREINIDIFEDLETMKNNIKNYDILVISEILDIQTLIEYNYICRANNKKFIYSSALGLSGFVFNDFGDEHLIINKTGDEPQSVTIKNISKEKEGIITINADKDSISLYEFSDYVIFKNIKGMTELNDKEPKKIKIINKQSFSIGDTSNYNEYLSGGIVKEAFIPIKKKFQSFKDSFFNPFTEDLLGQSINMKKGIKELYHVCLIAIHHFLNIHSFIPETNNKSHIEEVIKIIELMINFGNDKKWIKNIKSINKKYLENIIRWCKCSISPICSFLGGIVSQEIIKIAGKYNPISQWLYFDFFEKIEHLDLNRVTYTLNSRYNDQISIFDQSFQDKLANLNVFIIGAGALGCEFIKILSLMGIGTNNDKYITITDNDNIELSNLNRQFLFKKKDNGFSKSEISCREGKKINNKINFVSKNLKVCFKTENIFNDDFWEKQNLIICAIDNDSGRRYIDNQCTFFNKIFLESGTSGTSASSMVIYPHKTTCYDELEKVMTKEIPMCTLKSFPSQIEHCIEFSKIYFSEFFEKNIEYLNSLIKDTETFFRKTENSFSEKKDLIEIFEEVRKLLILYKNKNITDLIEYSMEKYYIFFNKNINDLLERIPEYSLDENGEPFWTGSKIMPHSFDFNSNDELSINFIIFFIRIINRILELNLNINENEIINNTSKIYEKIVLKKPILYSEVEQKEIISEKKNEILKLVQESELKEKIFKPEIFEKDNDNLYHVDFIYCFSNLRARNYNIEECDREKARKIAGNIIPAIVSTTACVAGFVAMQIYSVVLSDDINTMKNIGLDLGTNWYSVATPEQIKTYQSISKKDNINPIIKIPEKFSIWDTIILNGTMTFKEMIELFKKEYNFYIEYINSNDECLLDLIENESDEEMNKKIEELYFETFKDISKNNKKYLKLSVLGTQNDINMNIPRIKYILN